MANTIYFAARVESMYKTPLFCCITNEAAQVRSYALKTCVIRLTTQVDLRHTT